MNQPPAYVAAFQSVSVGGNLTVQVQQFSPEEKEELLVDLYHLPKPTTALVGRQKELNQLTEAFTNHKNRLAIIVAAGGIGKSALTDEWLQHIAEHNYYGKTRVFGWSFYSQGSHNTFTNSQPFFSAVLPFLGIDEIPKDEIEKARLLVRCLQQQPCLLILDGLEPLQYTENLQSMNGELQDSALKEFILQFRLVAGQSFVLLSSRQPLVEVTEKNRWHKEHFLELRLETLLAPPYDIEHDDGIALLKALEVKGSDEELHKVSKDLNGHALSLVLMGHLLVEHHAGDPRYAKELPPLTSAHGDSDAEKDSRHALRVLDYYDSLQDAASRCFLQLLGLFDRPMNAAEKATLIANADHAAPLRALTDAEWKKLEQRLESNGLLLGKKGIFRHLVWDTHPIIREYFGKKFKGFCKENFKQAHWVLFDYYQKLPNKKQPSTLKEMEPLYSAVVHSCLAEKYQEALISIYKDRICHGEKILYSQNTLGAYANDLIALSSFFPKGWESPITGNLQKSDQAWLLGESSSCLMFQGRLIESVSPCKLAIRIFVDLKDWNNAAIYSANLSDTLLLLGKLNDAQISGETAIEYSLLIDDKLRQGRTCRSLATVLHRQGELKKSRQIFLQAKNLLHDNNPDSDYLFSLLGAAYSAYLIDVAKRKEDFDEVLKNITYAMDISKSHQLLLDTSFNQLNLGRIYQSLHQSEYAEDEFNFSLQGIIQADSIMDYPEFYLCRANFYITEKQLSSAKSDLNSALEIIERFGMKMYQVDYCLIHGRYSLVIQDFDAALNHYEEAKNLIQETGYHLRDAELDLLAAQYCRSSKKGLNAKDENYYLQKAKNRIEEIGQWGLMRVIERDFPR